MSQRTRRLASLVTLPLAMAGLIALSAGPAAAKPVEPAAPPGPASQNVLISQVSTQGPGGATDEFVELRNVGPSSIDISNYTLWSCSNANQLVLLATIPAGTVLSGSEQQIGEVGQFYLLAGTGYNRLTPQDQTYNGNIARTGGVLLRAMPAPGSTMGARVDSVGFDRTNSCTETAPAQAQSSQFTDEASLRVSDVDTNNNAFDFVRVSPALPRNSSSF